jgi:hypothetical protein
VAYKQKKGQKKAGHQGLLLLSSGRQISRQTFSA